MSKVKELIKLTGLNQTEFGERVGLDKTRISKYASGKHEIPLSLFLEWADVFDLKIMFVQK